MSYARYYVNEITDDFTELAGRITQNKKNLGQEKKINLINLVIYLPSLHRVQVCT